MNSIDKYGFIIDTNKYSGNFERELCAYVTGHIGECNVGCEEAEEYCRIFNKIKNVIIVPDSENLCERPVEICTTPNVWNNGLGFHFINGEEEIALQEYKKSAQKETEKNIKVIEGYRGKNLFHWTDEAIDKQIEIYLNLLDETLSRAEVEKYPAYQSLMIHLSSIPSNEVIKFMKKRAHEYANREDIKITSFRIKMYNDYHEKDELI
ncbi:gp332 [Bacillus phage G]|uniref:Gp332 n=1 Tax=Bacillus phage G TaxID=2884420 RepID=G3MA73_9CAUD|nr:gp332 [Bacillus phage G]AEO93591.1 gp332 [Bacillus phage G]